MNKKVLVTGGAGYIGTVLVQELLKKGYKVRVLDSCIFGKKPLKNVLNKIELVKKDIRDVNKNILEGIFAVIHQAGLSNDPMADFDPVANRKINTVGTLRLASFCKENGIKRFTFSSSASIYDQGILKTSNLQDENFKVAPKSAYSISKYEAEIGLIKMADKDFCPVIIRQGTVYGYSPRMRFDLVVNSMLKTALTENKIYVFCKGIQWRPLVDIKDVATAHIKAIEADVTKITGQIIDLVFKNYQIFQLAKIVKKTTEKIKNNKVEIIVNYAPRKDRSYRIKGEKIKKILNWKPKISVEESIINIIKKTEKWGFGDFNKAEYYNIEFIKKKNKEILI